MPSDGKSSHGLWPGELKTHIIGITKNKTLDYVHCMDTISLFISQCSFSCTCSTDRLLFFCNL